MTDVIRIEVLDCVAYTSGTDLFVKVYGSIPFVEGDKLTLEQRSENEWILIWVEEDSP